MGGRINGGMGGRVDWNAQTMKENSFNHETGELDPLYDRAVEIVVRTRSASVSLVQRHLRIGYNRAARLIETMEQAGLVSAMQPNGTREVLDIARTFPATRAKAKEAPLVTSRFKGLPSHPHPTSPVPQPFAGATAPPPRSLIDRIFSNSRADLAAQALATLLASRSPAAISRREITAIHEAYGISLEQVRELHVDAWRHALAYVLSDHGLATEKSPYLDALRLLFDISFDEADKAENEIVVPRFRKYVEEVFVGKAINDIDKQYLRDIATGLRIPEDKQRSVCSQVVATVIARQTAAIAKKRRATSSEYNEIMAFSEAAGVELDPETTITLLDAYFCWLLEEDKPWQDAPVPETMSLDRGERYYIGIPVSWYEIRRQRNGAEEPERIDSGELHVTGKRLLFVGSAKTMTIRLSESPRVSWRLVGLS